MAVNGKTREPISIRDVHGKPSEEYYKWQFIHSLVDSGLYARDYIGVEIQFPKGNSQPLRLDGAIFDDPEWLDHYNAYWKDRHTDDLEWLNAHLLAVIEFKKSDKEIEKVFTSQVKQANLAVSVIGKSLYSETYKPGWYELIRPVNISEYGTLNSREWLGSSKDLPVVKQGDLILGCEGFGKGRSIVLIEAPTRCTTNFHGTVLSCPGAEIWKTIFVRCFLAYLREHGVIDWVGVGGSGGHMSPEYFDYLPFPKFPDSIQNQIAELYHHGATPPTHKQTLDNFAGWHREWNKTLGIWELDREMKKLQKTLADVQEKIIEGSLVKLPF